MESRVASVSVEKKDDAGRDSAGASGKILPTKNDGQPDEVIVRKDLPNSDLWQLQIARP